MGRSKNVDSWMAELDPSVRQIAESIRSLILNTAPELNETIKWSQPVYQKSGDIGSDDRSDTFRAKASGSGKTNLTSDIDPHWLSGTPSEPAAWRAD